MSRPTFELVIVKTQRRLESKPVLSSMTIAMIGLLLSGYAVSAESLLQYTSECLSELGNITSIPQFSCKADPFRTPTGIVDGLDFSRSTDFVAHRQINNSVDAVFACRWVGGGNDPDLAATGEMIVHNRHNGATCFFEMLPGNQQFYSQVDTNPVSPTDSTAASVWKQGTDCTQCHAAGAYVASAEIVGALAKYGLINDNHDTWNGFYHPVGSGTQAPVVTQPDCSSACHVMGGTPAVASRIGHDIIEGAVVMPSINYIFDQLTKLGHMPPNDPESDYRWINRDDPGFSGDHEDLGNIAREYPPMSCSNPNYLEAHVVDSPEIITTNLPDTFNRFNLQDGLVCLNGEQSGGHRCRDYQTRYMCNGKFTAFQNLDTPSSSGDWEPRNSFKNLCANPTWIQARFTDRGKWVYINGPADRLAQFDSGGLVCLNSQQDNGKCSNYVVRFGCP